MSGRQEKLCLHAAKVTHSRLPLWYPPKTCKFATLRMQYTVKIFSRIGELIQGILPDRSPFLVSGFPSRTFFSQATLDDAPASPLPRKALQALTLFLQSAARE